MSRVLISPEEIAIGSQLLLWAETYLMRDEEKIQRPYRPRTVCPFVEASVRRNAFFMTFHSEIGGDQVEPIVDLLSSYIKPFARRPGKKAEKTHQALLVVFPRLDPSSYHLLDKAHELTKDRMVESGLMIGQFHPECRTPAVHNSAWRGVSVAPYPLMAIRHMVVHDILFLRERKDWFLQYQARYGNKYERPSALTACNAHLLPVYNEAKMKFLELDTSWQKEPTK